MFERTESRLVAAVAFMLLFVAGAGTLNWLAAAPFPIGVRTIVEEQPARPSPHLFLGEVKLASTAEGQLARLAQSAEDMGTTLQSAEVNAASPVSGDTEANAEPSEPPTARAATSTSPFPADTKPHFFKGPIRFAIEPSAKAEPAASEPEAKLVDLPQRAGHGESELQPAKLFEAERPHYFTGSLQLADLRQLPSKVAPVTPLQAAEVVAAPRIEAPAPESETQLASLPPAVGDAVAFKPAEVFPTGRPHFFAGPFRLASVPTGQLPLKSVQPKEAPTVQPASFSASEPQLAELPQRFPGPSISLVPAEMQPATAGKHAAGEMHLVNLPQRFPAPAVALNSAEVTPVQSGLNPMIMSEFRLTSLQQRAPEPATPLQPAEVLPIPTPNSPAAPRVPDLDQDRPIGALTTNIAPPSGKLPVDIAAEKFQGDFPAYLPRPWGEVAYFWDAPDLCYGGLRYEEVNLERFGYSHCPIVQPAISAAHFFCATLALPYNMTVHPHGECIYPLGHYRPGSPVPFRHIRPEANVLAASAEVGTIAGLILLIP